MEVSDKEQSPCVSRYKFNQGLENIYLENTNLSRQLNVRHLKPLKKAEVMFMRSHLISARCCGEHVIHLISFNIDKDVEPSQKSKRISFALVSLFWFVRKGGRLILCHEM